MLNYQRVFQSICSTSRIMSSVAAAMERCNGVSSAMAGEPPCKRPRPAGSREPVVPEKSPNDAGQESMVPTPYLSGSMSIGGDGNRENLKETMRFTIYIHAHTLKTGFE